MSEQLFPEAIRLMRARHRLDNFRRIVNIGVGKTEFEAIVEELRLIELELYKAKPIYNCGESIISSNGLLKCKKLAGHKGKCKF